MLSRQLVCYSTGVAIDLIRRCRGNLELAFNIHFKKVETLPHLEPTSDPFAAGSSSPDPSFKPSAMSVTPGRSEATSPGAAEGINHSILTLLVMLRSIMQTSLTTPPRQLTSSGSKPQDR